MEKLIYHVTTIQEWNAAQEKGYYEAASLHSEGFIHCSDASQVAGVLSRYFQNKKDLVKLTIDPSKLKVKPVYEISTSIAESFPHIYGVIALDAVIETTIL